MIPCNNTNNTFLSSVIVERAAARYAIEIVDDDGDVVVVVVVAGTTAATAARSLSREVTNAVTTRATSTTGILERVVPLLLPIRAIASAVSFWILAISSADKGWASISTEEEEEEESGEASLSRLVLEYDDDADDVGVDWVRSSSLFSLIRVLSVMYSRNPLYTLAR